MTTKLTPLQYIKVDIANNYGHDKMDWQDRIDWVDAQDNLRGLFMTAPMKSKFQYLSAVMAYEDAIAGVPTGHVVGLDATASGLQLFAALTGCVKTATRVNLVDTGRREEAYGYMARTMSNLCDDYISRDRIKNPLMTFFYGSKAEPESIFGKGTNELRQFYRTIETDLPGGMYGMEQIQSCWQSGVKAHKFTLPDGHTAHVRVMQEYSAKIEVSEFAVNGKAPTFTFKTERNEPMEKGISLAANVIHGIDGYVVREMRRRCYASGFEILTIHDDFRCSPIHCETMRNHYREILAEIAESNLLQDILTEITGFNGVIHKQPGHEQLPDLIRNSDYALS